MYHSLSISHTELSTLQGNSSWYDVVFLPAVAEVRRQKSHRFITTEIRTNLLGGKMMTIVSKSIEISPAVNLSNSNHSKKSTVKMNRMQLSLTLIIFHCLLSLKSLEKNYIKSY